MKNMVFEYKRLGDNVLPVWNLRFSKGIDGESGKYVFYTQDSLKKFLEDNQQLFKIEDFGKTFAIDYVNEYNEVYKVEKIHV